LVGKTFGAKLLKIFSSKLFKIRNFFRISPLNETTCPSCGVCGQSHIFTLKLSNNQQQQNNKSMATRKNNKRLAEIEAELADSEDENDEVQEKQVATTRGRSAATSRKAAKTKGDVVELDVDGAEEDSIPATRGRIAAATRKAFNKRVSDIEEEEDDFAASTRGRASTSRKTTNKRVMAAAIKVEDLFDSEAEEAKEEEEEEGEGEEAGSDNEEEPVVTTRGRGSAPFKASDKRVVSASKGIADGDVDEQIARGRSLGIISPDMANAVERLGMALKASNVVGNPVTLHRIW
jgi:hypothetical protein